ncbi:MAG: hypothetical protein F4X59_15050 [Holophagales bacterium]|nr:hypothetical protein [Holophagales bacterium]MYC11430.1 hypothetical protein [Holophagales bacterium]
MSTSPITFDQLLELTRAGYTIQLDAKYLIVKGVPYVNGEGEVSTADIISALDYAGTSLAAPQHHTVWWTGSVPHRADRLALDGMCVDKKTHELDEGLTVTMQLSQKWRDEGGGRRNYLSYNEKLTTYIHIVRQHADAIVKQSE